MDVGHEQVVAHQLAAVSDAVGQFLPAFPILFAHAVLDGVNGIFRDELFQVGYLLVHAQLLAVRVFGHAVLQVRVVVVELAVLLHAELGCGTVHRNADVFSRPIACLPDGLDDAVQSVLHTVQFRGETAFIANGRTQSAPFQYFLQGMEYFSAHAQAFTVSGGTDGTNHEFLESNRGIAVGASVDDVHHRHRHHVGVGSADVAIQRDVQISGGGLGYGQRHAEDGIGSQAGLGGGAVQFEHLVVDGTLLQGRHADEGGGNDLVYVLYGFQCAFAQIAALVAIAQFEGFILSGRSTGRHGGSSHDTTF